MRKVAVLFGGKSCENEISVLTGIFVLNLIDREKFIPIPVYIHTDWDAVYLCEDDRPQRFQKARLFLF